MPIVEESEKLTELPGELVRVIQAAGVVGLVTEHLREYTLRAAKHEYLGGKDPLLNCPYPVKVASLRKVLL